MRRRAGAAVALGVIGGGLAVPAVAQAHALVGKRDLPIPAWLFAWGASLVLIVSFFLLSYAWSECRFEGDSWRPLSEPLSRLVLNPVTEVLAGAIGVLGLGVGVWAGLYGVGTPDLNFALTFFFVTAWLGIVLLSVLFGDVFRAFNPWRAIARAFAAFLRLLAGRTPEPPLSYPERLGRWPAAGVVVGFVWLELVYGASGFQAVGVEPRSAAIAALVYSAYALGGMALFGIEAWLDRGEGFSAYFKMFSQLSIFEVRARRLGRRWPLSGATEWALVPGSLALILVTIGGTTFDGAQEGTLAGPISSLGHRFLDVGFGPTLALRVDETIFLALTVARGPLAAVDAPRDGGVHEPRAVPAVAVERMSGSCSTVVVLPLAHLLHWYFMPLYATPMLIVLYSTIKETIRQRREHEDEES